MKIGDFDLSQKILIVAEIGNNHEGKFETAQELIRQAAKSGAHAVKFQTYKTKYFINARDRARYEKLSSFELSFAQFDQLQALAKRLRLLFISTPLDLESARFLERLVDAYKISSSDNNFYPLIAEVCKTGKPLIISTGLTTLEEIEQTKHFVVSEWKKHNIRQDLAMLHCVTCYPLPLAQANLLSIPFLHEKLGITIGYSDHTAGISACLASAALGARILEKHFTLDKHYSDFRDHQLSADPFEMKSLVKEVECLQAMLGKPQKALQPCETSYLPLVRRSIVAVADLPNGHRLVPPDLMWTRPAGGLPPGQEDKLVGKKLKRSVAFGDMLTLTDVE